MELPFDFDCLSHEILITELDAYGLKGLHRIFCGTTEKCKKFKLTFILIQISEMHRAGRVDVRKIRPKLIIHIETEEEQVLLDIDMILTFLLKNN